MKTFLGLEEIARPFFIGTGVGGKLVDFAYYVITERRIEPTLHLTLTYRIFHHWHSLASLLDIAYYSIIPTP